MTEREGIGKVYVGQPEEPECVCCGTVRNSPNETTHCGLVGQFHIWNEAKLRAVHEWEARDGH